MRLEKEEEESISRSIRLVNVQGWTLQFSLDCWWWWLSKFVCANFQCLPARLKMAASKAGGDLAWSWWFNFDRSQFWYIRSGGDLANLCVPISSVCRLVWKWRPARPEWWSSVDVDRSQFWYYIRGRCSWGWMLDLTWLHFTVIDEACFRFRFHSTVNIFEWSFFAL